jgi:hypothetical protein
LTWRTAGGGDTCSGCGTGGTKRKRCRLRQMPRRTQPRPGRGAARLRQPLPAQAAVRATPDIETALGTRWAVWVGGLALAFGGGVPDPLFHRIRHFRPRLCGSAWPPCSGWCWSPAASSSAAPAIKVPIQNGSGAYIPAILTAAGAFILVRHDLRRAWHLRLHRRRPAFVLLGIVGVATIAAALAPWPGAGRPRLARLDGDAGAGRVDRPNPWALFGYLAIVLVATAVVARTRDWSLRDGRPPSSAPACLDAALSRRRAAGEFCRGAVHRRRHAGGLALLWLGRDDEPASLDWPSMVPAFFVAMTSVVLFIHPTYAALGGPLRGHDPADRHAGGGALSSGGGVAALCGRPGGGARLSAQCAGRQPSIARPADRRPGLSKDCRSRLPARP